MLLKIGRLKRYAETDFRNGYEIHSNEQKANMLNSPNEQPREVHRPEIV
jgi:hypothetical protein